MSQEEYIQQLETSVPAASGAAFLQARNATLASGHAILFTEKDILYRLEPSGVRTEIKKIDPPTHVTVGTGVQLK